MRAALVLLLAGCTHPPPSATFDVPLEAASQDEVVATVDRRAIRAGEIAAQARAAGSTAKQALDDLIRAELLTGEAARRGLERDRDVQLAIRQSAAHRLLESDFETQVTPSSLPERLVRSYYNKHRNLFDHSEYVDVWHILCPDRASAEDIAKRARGIGSADAFKALADGKPYKVEQIVTAREGWVETAFSHAAFDQLKAPGDTSSPIETRYGFHVLYLNRRIPPRHLTLDEARPEMFPEAQREEFKRYLNEAMRRHHVEEHAERIK
jgi:peptidyl-prolyl cis-trans isomerase C